jgi:predicted DNA-binding transcriptional regulator YafY
MSPKFNLDLTPEEGILLLTGARLLDKLVAGIRIQSRDRDELISEVISKVADNVPPALNRLSGEIADAIVEAVAGQADYEELEDEFGSDEFDADDEKNSCSYPMYSIDELLPVIEQAVSKQYTLAAEYYSFAHESVDAYTLNPFAILQDGKLWKMIAYCRERDRVMVFRVDRIKNLLLTGGTFEAPDGFNPQQPLPFAG